MTLPGAGALRDLDRAKMLRYDAELFAKVGKDDLAAEKAADAELYELHAQLRQEVYDARAAYEAALAAEKDASDTVTALRAAGVPEDVIDKVHRQTSDRLPERNVWKSALNDLAEARRTWRRIGQLSGRRGPPEILNNFVEPSDQELLDAAGGAV